MQTQSGFVRRQLLQGSDGQWSDIVHWRTLAEAHQVAEAVMQEPSCHPFMGMIDESSMTMFHMQQAQTIN